jgi:hypothetical protein
MKGFHKEHSACSKHAVVSVTTISLLCDLKEHGTHKVAKQCKVIEIKGRPILSVQSTRHFPINQQPARVTAYQVCIYTVSECKPFSYVSPRLKSLS